MKKNFIKLILGLFVLTFALLPVSAKTFPDVSSDYWAASQIKELSYKGIIVGYPDGTFKPNAKVTRAEFATMAILALGQEHTKVSQPVNFLDVPKDYWAYDMIQKALYFELISCPDASQMFRPDDSVSYAEAMTVAVNALTTESISPIKAKEVLSKNYTNIQSVPDWFLVSAGKAEILNMNVQEPKEPKILLTTAPATRAEVVVLLKNMMEQAKLNPNQKLAEAMRKKTGDGFVVDNAYVQGNIGTIPAGSIVPVQVGKALSSQFSKPGELYMGKATQNYVTRDKFILIYKDSNLNGKLIDVRPGKLFIRNGVLVLKNDSITTPNEQNAIFNGVADVHMNKNWFIAFLRRIFKGEKVKVLPQGTVYVKLLSPVQVDLTNGWIME